jgi:hypothetical protein
VARNVMPTLNQMIHAQIGMAAHRIAGKMGPLWRQIAAEQTGGSIG